MADATDLHSLAEEFLSACEESLNTIPTFDASLDGAPARSFVSHGIPAYDCCNDGQLTVHVAAINEGPLAFDGQSQITGRKNMVTFVATIVRCVPVESGNFAPSPAELGAVGEQGNADAWAIWNHIFNLIQAEQLFALCSSIIWEGLRTINPQGGCAGHTLTIRAEVDGYQEVIAT